MEFYGLLGEKLGHSVSPEIHHKFFSIVGIEGAYKKFEVDKEDLCKVADSVKILKIKGMNVTIPYKRDIMPYLDYISDEAKKIDAVNTVLLKDGKLYGYNSDYYGFGTILDRNGVEAENKVAMVLGTGGASKAAVTYLLDKNVKVLYLVSRRKTTEKVYEDNRVKCVTYEEINDIKGDIIVNATPVGMYPKIDASPVEEDIINNFNVLIDIVYNPRMTKFLQIGKKLNKKICGGMEMLVGQAIKSEEIWQNMKVEDKVFEEIYNDSDK